MNKALYLLFMLVPLAVKAQDGTAIISKSFANETFKTVYSRTSSGSITVEGGNQSRVEAYVKANNGRNLSDEEIKERLKRDYNLIIDVEGDQLTVTAENKDRSFNWRDGLSISFKIYVPQNVSTDLVTSGGGINMRQLSGTHNFTTSGGGLRLDKLSGKIRGRTSGGGIVVSNSKDQIDLSTSGGGIEASDCSGTISLSTSGGGIRLENLDGSIRANTSGGPIRGGDIKGDLYAHTSGGGINLQNMECALDVSTSGGGMDIEVDNVKGSINARNSGGNIRMTLPGNKGLDLRLRGNKVRVDNLSNFDGNREDHRVDGKLNGGGVAVNIQTSGSITLALN